MATPKNSAKPLGYKDTPHNGVYLTCAPLRRFLRQTRQCFVGGIGLLYKICGIGFFKKCMLHDILNKKFKHL